MDKIYLKARAKINLSLEILNKREDGYHNLKSVFQKINLYDEIYIEKNNTNSFKLQTNIKSLNNEENIIYKAYIKLKEKYSAISGVNVSLNKKIPMQAGLGGGSTDCASFILGMNKLFDLNLSKNKMEEIGKNLGADVVPCFYNKAVLAEGIGEKITKLNTNFKYYVVIVKPNINFSTKEMYNLLDKNEKINNLNVSNKIISGLQKNDIKIIANNLYNSFESILDENNIILKIKKDLIKNGAIASLMTGSGSCVFGIFENKKIAKNAYENLKGTYKSYICTSYNIKRSEKFD